MRCCFNERHCETRGRRGLVTYGLPRRVKGPAQTAGGAEMKQLEPNETHIERIEKLEAEVERLCAVLQGIIKRYETAEEGWPMEDMVGDARLALGWTLK